MGLSCTLCRQKKRKCDRTYPACKRCIGRGQICPGYDYKTQRRSKNVRNSTLLELDTSSPNQRSIMPNQSQLNATSRTHSSSAISTLLLEGTENMKVISSSDGSISINRQNQAQTTRCGHIWDLRKKQSLYALYENTTNSGDGLYYYPFEGGDCRHSPTERIDKHYAQIDSHLKIFYCQIRDCGRRFGTAHGLQYYEQTHNIPGSIMNHSTSSSRSKERVLDNSDVLPVELDVTQARVARYIEVRTMLRCGLMKNCNPSAEGNLNHLCSLNNLLKEMASITMQLQLPTKESNL